MTKPDVVWIPRPQQAKVLEAALEAPGGKGRTILETCKEAGVPPRTFYNWMRDDPGFKAAWNQLHRQALSRCLPGVAAAQIHKALEGDTRAAELVFKAAGQLSSKVELAGAHGGPVRVQTDARIRPDPSEAAAILAALRSAGVAPKFTDHPDPVTSDPGDPSQSAATSAKP